MEFSRQEYWSGLTFPSPEVGDKPVKFYRSSGPGCLGHMWSRLLMKDDHLTSDQHGICRGRQKCIQLSIKKNGGVNMSFVMPTSHCISVGPNELSK